ncbi:GspH/FimT family pseudopilin [Candidatus Methylospira mobilis]|uniref:GspH/FimT family pseudopilin n=1 Tax=Candidatus Methylospira mobilis TaxID=1808979 RepID=UPI001885139F|nr:GspH/FimT family pseudopilin [Candidatus Methylospira mobilis]
MIRHTQKTPAYACGFTLIELLATLAVMGIVLSIGIPSYHELIRSNRLTTQINEFSSSLNLARSEAIRRGIRVTVRKHGDEWESGWQIFTDLSNNGLFDESSGDELLRQHDALAGGYTLRGNHNFVNFVSFLPDGSSNNMGAFALCDNSDDSYIPHPGASKLIIINNIGRTRIGADSNGNGIPEKETSNGNATDISSCASP